MRLNISASNNVHVLIQVLRNSAVITSTLSFLINSSELGDRNVPPGFLLSINS
ncbi:hypothetical protein ACFWGC_27805 [Cytobacillus pseudoceanisediminis]|uniref:hypothetical protein n=1 Tax=Cytobacillus pseudoceanisediminis TaxID=3051614 RepID=UPI00365A4CFE